MSLDELLGLAFTLYILGSVLAALLRRGRTAPPPRRQGPARGEPGEPWPDDGGGDGQPWDWEPRSWEEELREIFGERREPEPREVQEVPPADAPREVDDRPWLEVEPIPPLEPASSGPPPFEPPPFEPETVEVPPSWEPEPAGGRPPGAGRGAPAELPAAVPWRGPVPGGVPAVREPVAGRRGSEESTAWAVKRPQPSRGERLRRQLRAQPELLRDAVVLNEVLSPPRAMRPYRPPWAAHRLP